MKRLYTFLALLICLTAVVHAQSASRHKTYFMLTFGGGIGTHLTGTLSLDVISPTDFFFSASYWRQGKDAPEVPSDYNKGLTFFGDGVPEQATEMFALTFGKVFPSSHPRCRYVLSGGLGMGTFQEPTNFVRRSQDIFSLSSNYSYSEEKTPVVGLLFTPRIEFPIARWFGLSIGTLININSKDSAFALTTAMQFGRLRKKLPPKAAPKS